MKIQIESGGSSSGRVHHIDDDHAVTILSGGNASTTRVLGPGGAEIKWVRKVEILPIESGTSMQAVIHLFMPKIDIAAEPILALDVVEASAAYHGFRLVALTEDSADGAIPEAGA